MFESLDPRKPCAPEKGVPKAENAKSELALALAVEVNDSWLYPPQLYRPSVRPLPAAPAAVQVASTVTVGIGGSNVLHGCWVPSNEAWRAAPASPLPTLKAWGLGSIEHPFPATN